MKRFVTSTDNQNRLTYFLETCKMVMFLTTCTFLLSLTVSPSWLKEAEKKHGRVAMLSLPTLTAISLANQGIDPVPWLNHQPASMQLGFYSVAGILESFNLRRLDKGFTLKHDEIPGKLLNFTASPRFEQLEDVAGRAAMLGATGMLLDSIRMNGGF